MLSNRQIILKFALLLTLVGLLTWLVGPGWGFGAGFAIALTAWVYGNSRLQLLFNWLSDQRHARVPEGRGLWDESFSLLYRRQRLHQHQLQQLTAALDSFRRAAQAMPDGVLTLNRDNQITWCNDTAAMMLMLDPVGDAGQPINNLLRNPDFTAYLESKAWDRPVSIRTMGAEPQSFSIQIVEFGEGQRLMLVRDITQLERLETMRRDFVANVSHELKTPLTVLAGFLETMNDHDDMPATQQRHFLALMNDQAVRMRHIVEDLLALSALEAHPVASRDTVVEMDPLLARLESAAQSLSAGRHVISMQADSGTALYGAETELASAFENLISNAIRYTPHGGKIDIVYRITDDWIVEPTATGEPGEAVKQRVAKFSVKDTGIGIDAQHIPRLTERFYRVDRSRSRDSGGTGLGLAIVKHVLTRHDGQLRIESTRGQGTTMSVLLPARRIARAAAHNALVNPT